MEYKLHLKDKFLHNFILDDYIDFVAESENKELYEELRLETEKLINSLYTKVYGDQWESLKNKIFCPVETIYVFPLQLNYRHTIKCNYPKIDSLPSLISKSEISRISNLHIEIEERKEEIKEDLQKRGIMGTQGSDYLKIDTWEELLSKCPNCIEWWIEKFLDENKDFYDKVVIVTPDQDLEDLKNAIRS